MVALSLLAPALASQAQAAVLLQIPKMPSNLTIFPERDFISMGDFPANKPMEVEVTRGGVVVGSASGVTDNTGTLEVNHPGGVCWANSTPDLLPGDVVAVFEKGHPETAVGQSTIDVTAQAGTAMALDADGVMNDFVVHGTAADALGARLDLANVEQRVVNPDLLPFVGKRDIRAVVGGVAPDGDLAWDATAGPTGWTATYRDLGVGAATTAQAGQTRALAWHEVNLAGDRLGITIFEAGEVGGPGLGGCPLGAMDAPTVTSPRVVNMAAMAAGGDLTLSGVSFNSANVSVTVSGPDGAVVATATAVPTPAPSAGAPPTPGVNQTWTTAIPVSALAGVPDGELKLSITTKRVIAGIPTVIAGASRFLPKDTIAPAAPTLSLGTGTYVGAQMVSVTGSADTSALRYQLGGPNVTDPTMASAPVTGQIAVTSSQSLKVVGFDAADNPSVVRAVTYTINGAVPVPAAAPPAVVFPPAASPPAAVPPLVVVAAPPVVGPRVVVPPAAVVPGAKPAVLRAPSAPRIRAARSGALGGRLTAAASWQAPLRAGGRKITSYRVVAQRMSPSGNVLTSTTSASIRPGARSAVLRLRAGTYRFRVVAVNAVGKSAMSARSNAVRAR